MKKALIFGLIAAMLMLLTACGKNTAATIRLMKTEGNVHVSNDSGQDVETQENLPIYSGYGIDTASASYAWMNLDDTKLAKMDEDSAIQIQKAGKDLEIQVEQGGLFFHVTEPLTEDETMNIRTSTMSVGIRGTCGWVVAPDPEHMTLYLLEGTVECIAGENTATATAGQMAVMTADGEVTVTGFYQEDIPDFVWEELAENADLTQAAEQLEKMGNAVSNIRFEIELDILHLKWDAPANAESLTPSADDELGYCIYLKEGDTWVPARGESYERELDEHIDYPDICRDEFTSYPMLIAGTYNGVKIETVVSSLNSNGTYQDSVVGVCEDLSLSLTVSRENSGLRSVDFEEGLIHDLHCWNMTVSSVMPGSTYELLCAGEGGGVGGTFLYISSDGIPASDGFVIFDQTAAGQYLIVEYANLTVSADGKACSYTVLRHGDWQDFNLQ